VCLWDVRKLHTLNNTPVMTMPHFRSINCAYFSPTGEHLVTVGQDNYVNIFSSLEGKHEDPHDVEPTIKIPHNNVTGRWLTKLHASWDPKRPDQFVLGCMMQPRRVQIFRATHKNPLQELTSDLFNSVHSINVFHPHLDVIAGGNSSGRLCLWRTSRSTRRHRKV
jgi:WD40 repeat protein